MPANIVAAITIFSVLMAIQYAREKMFSYSPSGDGLAIVSGAAAAGAFFAATT